jgi:hypothetical protein
VPAQNILPVAALAAGTTATLLARSSSPVFLPGAGSWAGNNWQYGVLLTAWPAAIALVPELCRALRGPLAAVFGAAAVWACCAVGFNMLPLGGYYFARVGLYFYSFLGGASLVVAIRLAGDEKRGRAWSNRIAACLSLVFIMLGGMFLGAREGVLSRGPDWSTVMPGQTGQGGTAIEHRILFERPFSSAAFIAVQPEGGSPGQTGVPAVARDPHPRLS